MGRGRSARNAVEAAFYETINRVLSCISGDGLRVIPSGENRTTLSFPRMGPAVPAELLTRNGDLLHLSVAHSYAVVEVEPGRWHVRTESYIYTIYDAERREAIGYHYHPKGRGPDAIPVPHLHVHQSGIICGAYLPKVHLRTGRVALEDVVELLVTDFGVEPREDDWSKTLAAARATFATDRTWSSLGRVED
jgi:hypothetical protein